jgi:hypothetical protein
MAHPDDDLPSSRVERALRGAAGSLRAEGHPAEARQVDAIARGLSRPPEESRLAHLLAQWEAEVRKLDAMLNSSSGSVRDSIKSRRAGVRACIEDLRRALEP